jgi:hypothetical protein
VEAGPANTAVREDGGRHDGPWCERGKPRWHAGAS